MKKTKREKNFIKAISKLIFAGLMVGMIPTSLFSYTIDTKRSAARPSAATPQKQPSPVPKPQVTFPETPVATQPEIFPEPEQATASEQPETVPKPEVIVLDPLESDPQVDAPSTVSTDPHGTVAPGVQITTKEVNIEITKLKKTIKKLKNLKVALPVAVGIIGAGVLVASGAAIIGSFALASFDFFATAGAVLLLGTGAFVATAKLLPLSIATALAGVSLKQVFETTKGINKLEKIAIRYPSIITEDQRRSIAEFKKLIKNKLIKSYLKGLRIKETLDQVSREAIIEKGQYLYNYIDPTKVFKVVRKLIQRQIEVKNLKEAIAIHETYRRDWSFGYQSKVDRLKTLEAKLKRDEKKYPGILNILSKATKKYSDALDSILSEYKSIATKVTELSIKALQKAIQTGIENVQQKPELVKKIRESKVTKNVSKLIRRHIEVEGLEKEIALHKTLGKGWGIGYKNKVNRLKTLKSKLERDDKKYPGLFDCLKEPLETYKQEIKDIQKKLKKTS